MDVLTIILACSVYPDDSLVRAMVDLASHGNQYFVGDLATLLTFDQSKSATDAQRVVSEIDKRGGRPAVGLMGLPPAWAARPIELPGKSGPARASADLFDACTNIRVGSAVLRDYYDSCSRTHSVTTLATPVEPSRLRTAAPEALRLCALRKYAADLGVDGFAEAVLSYLPRQRVFGSADVFAPATALGNPANACLCEEPRRKRRPPAPPGREVTRERPREPAADNPAREATVNNSPTRTINPGSSPILD
jgi:hypothetical protein